MELVELGETISGVSLSLKIVLLACRVTYVCLEAEVLCELAVVVEEDISVESLIFLLVNSVVALVAACEYRRGLSILLKFNIIVCPVGSNIALKGEALNDLP